MEFFASHFADLVKNPRTWLITGVAGFIGSNLLEQLLKLNQKVVGLDNFITGNPKNLDMVKDEVGLKKNQNFNFIEGDVYKFKDCQLACDGVDLILHQAAVGSVSKSIEDPLRTHRNNVDGFANIMVAAKESGVKKIVFASSSSVYGDLKTLPQSEEFTGNLLSPYAASKRTNELYGQTYSKVYDIGVVGLRYFNVFGPRQNPNGSYAAVIPKWITLMLNDEQCTINGDGSICRDFTFIDNVVYSNLLAATTYFDQFEVFNSALGGKITLNDLYRSLARKVEKYTGKSRDPIYGPQRQGDILTSSSDISKIRSKLGFSEVVSLNEGLKRTVAWYVKNR